MAIFSYVCLLAAFLGAVGGGLLALLQLWEKNYSRSIIIDNLHWLISLCLLLASAGLVHALFWQDYSVEYVAAYTDRVLPLFYRLTAFWAGQPGSMLFWALVTALTGSCFAFFCLDQTAHTRLWFWTFFYSIMAFFCLILTEWSNPFILLEPAPLDGQGLNPLLQNPGMIFHPPLLFMGYAGFTVPACLGLAQLLSPNPTDPEWFRQTRPFWLLSWIFLTAGIVLGAWWAYMELGWGGYWAWDPVENASLLPWLFASAVIHILVITRKSGNLNRISVSLMALTVISAVFATYLTRSGIIQSVHAFGDGGVGTPLLIFILCALFYAVVIPCSASPLNDDLSGPVSREGTLILTAWLFVTLAVIISLATMWPVLSKLWTSAPQGLDASFYNRVCLPLGVALLLLLGMCLSLGWRGGLKGGRELAIAFSVFTVTILCLWFADYHKFMPLIASGACVAVVIVMLVYAFKPGILANPWRRSALGAHIGFAILCIGVSFSAPYSIDKEMFLGQGENANIDGYVVSLERMEEGDRPGYDYLQAILKVTENQKQVGILKPERRIYAKFGDMQFSEVDVLSNFGRDIYASLLGMDEEHRIMVKISIEPLVNWIWIGGALMCLLPLLGLKLRKPNKHEP